MPELNPIEQFLRETVGPTSWDKIPEDERKRTVDTYSIMFSDVGPIAEQQDARLLYQPITPPERPDSLMDAFQGLLVHQGFSGKMAWSAIKTADILTGGVGEQMMQYVPGEGLKEYDADSYFADNLDDLKKTRQGRQLIDKYIMGEFDGADNSAQLASMIGYVKEEEHLRDEMNKMDTVEAVALGIPAAFLDPISLFGGLMAFKAVAGTAKGLSLTGSIARNVGEGFAISTISEGGQALLGADKDAETIGTNFLTGAMFDAFAAGIFHSLGRIGHSPTALAPEKVKAVQKLKQAVSTMEPPVELTDLIQQRAAAWKERQSSTEYVKTLNTTEYDYIPVEKRKATNKNEDDYYWPVFETPTPEKIPTDKNFGYMVVRKADGANVRFITHKELNEILDANVVAVDKKISKIKDAPISTGLNDDIGNLTPADFEPVSSPGLARSVLGSQNRLISNLDLEATKNPALNLIVARTFETMQGLKGWANGNLKGFASLETRLMSLLAKQNRIRGQAEGLSRKLIKQAANPARRPFLGRLFSSETLTAKELQQGQIVQEILELERTRNQLMLGDHIKQMQSRKFGEQPTDMTPDTLSVLNRDLLIMDALDRAKKLGLSDDIKAYRLLEDHDPDLAFLTATDKQVLGNQLDATRRVILSQYSNIRFDHLDPNFTSSKLVELIRAMKKLGPEVEVEKVLKDALTVTSGGYARLTPEDIAPGSINSPKTKQRLAQYWNEDLGGYLPIEHIPRALEIFPEGRLSLTRTLDSYMEFIRSLEGWTTYTRVFKETDRAFPEFSSRKDLNPLREKINAGIERFSDPKNWENGIPPYMELRNELMTMLDALEAHAKDRATEVHVNTGGKDPGGQERVERAFTNIRRKLGFIGSGVGDTERKLADIAGNLGRSVQLTTTGVTQLIDTNASIHSLAFNGAQKPLRNMLKGFFLQWNSMAGTPAMRNAFFRNLALTAETHLSFATDRMSAAKYELHTDNLSTQRTALGTSRGYSEALSGAVSYASGTNFMNVGNKGFTGMSLMQLLTDQGYGVLPRIDKALHELDKFGDLPSALKANDVPVDLGMQTLRTLSPTDVSELSKAILAGQYDEVYIKNTFKFLGLSDATIRIVQTADTAAGAEAAEKLAMTVNYLVDRHIAVPGWIESNARPAGFVQEMGATFLRQVMAVANRILVGSEYRTSGQRLALMANILVSASMVAFAKAFLNGTEDKILQNLNEHPGRFVADRLAYGGAFGVLGEKMAAYLLDSTSPDSYRRMNPGDRATSFPLQGAANLYMQGLGGLGNAVWNGDEMTEAQVKAMWKGLILGETTVAKGIQRVFNLMRDDEDAIDARNYFQDVMDATVGVKQGKAKSKE